MTAAQKTLLSQLIGLARATDGSEHLITPELTDVVIQALRAMSGDDPEAFVSAVIEAKRRIVPNCFTCAAPCGRTSPFDLAALEDEPEDLRDAKQTLIHLLCTIAKRGCTEMFARNYFFLGLIAVGTQPIAREPLEQLLAVLQSEAEGSVQSGR